MSQQEQQELSLEEIQLRALCNWCRNPLVMSEQFDESNFKDIGRKWHEDDSANAQAVYCGTCINDEFRTGQPKSVIDRTTLDECDVDQLPPIAAQQVAPQALTRGIEENMSINDKTI